MPTDREQAALQALEREGKARSSSSDAKRKKTPRPEQPRSLSNTERAANTLADDAITTPWSLSIAIVLPVGVAALAYWFTRHTGVSVTAFVLATTVAFGCMFVAQRYASRGAVAREQAWLDALPFAVQGWLDALGREPESGSLKLTISFVDEAPDSQALKGLAALVDATCSGQGGRQAAHAIVSSYIDVQIEDSDRKTNVPYLRWQRAALAQVVQPLHEAYPVERIRFERA